MTPHGCQKNTKHTAWLKFINIIPFDTLTGLLGILRGPNGQSRSGPFFFFPGPFLVKCCFYRNLSMCGVQIIATEYPDHMRQLRDHIKPSIRRKPYFLFGGPSKDKEALLQVPRRFLLMINYSR